jgi:RNA polymerase sigma-70 factor (ECF subfamily)
MIHQTRALGVPAVYAEHADFVRVSLARLGVGTPDIKDLLQEVFVIVHRRLSTFDGTSSMPAWLFGICKRVAAAHRRRAYVRRETAVLDVPESTLKDPRLDPEQVMAARQAGEVVEAILREIDVDKRAVFVMFELDELPCDVIAASLGVPVGTVHSRLHAARKAFQRALLRSEARAARRELRGAIPKNGTPGREIRG